MINSGVVIRKLVYRTHPFSNKNQVWNVAFLFLITCPVRNCNDKNVRTSREVPSSSLQRRPLSAKRRNIRQRRRSFVGNEYMYMQSRIHSIHRSKQACCRRRQWKNIRQRGAIRPDYVICLGCRLSLAMLGLLLWYCLELPWKVGNHLSAGIGNAFISHGRYVLDGKPRGSQGEDYTSPDF